MESKALAPQSNFIAERRIKTLPGEALFEGRLRDSNDSAILKLIGKAALTPHQQSRLESVVKNSKSCKHTSVAEIDRVELHESGALVAFRLPPGEFLFEFLGKKESLDLLSLKQRLNMLKGLSEGISHLHEKLGAVGAINPANVIVTSQTNRLILLDSGLSFRSGLAISGFSPVTTPFYAPEVITGGAPTIASDVFSFAALAFLLLTNQRPFSGENSNSIVASMLSYKTPNVGEYIKGASQRVVAVFSRAFSSNPSLRAHTITDFMRDLEETLVSCGVVSAGVDTTDFSRGKSETASTKTNNKGTTQKITIAAGASILVLLGVFLINEQKEDNDRTPEKMVSLIETSSQELPMVDPLSFKTENLSRLSELEIAALIAHPFTSEELGIQLAEEAISREILLRRELFESTLKSPYFRVKISALKALEKSGQGASLSEMVLALSSDEDPLVRGYAARTLGRVGNMAVVSGLEQWLLHEEDAQVQEMIRDSMGKIQKRLG
jgi:serine/threonine protein kinase